MVNQELLEYVRQQLASGVSKETIVKTAAQGGWEPQDLQEAFAANSQPTPSPVMPSSAAPLAPRTAQSAVVSPPTPTILPLCSYCHQPLLPTYYFCPNCGNKIASAPLSTSVGTQVWIYAFSAILPIICYLMITKWPGIKYFKSSDQKAKSIGAIAIVILVLSSVITFWYAYVWATQAIQASIGTVNTNI